MATVACGFVFSAMTFAAAQGKAMDDAKNAQKDPNAAFDGRKTTIKPEVKAGPVTKQDPKAISDKLNKEAAARQKGANLDGPKHAPPSPTIKATPPKQAPAAKAVPAKPPVQRRPTRQDKSDTGFFFEKIWFCICGKDVNEGPCGCPPEQDNSPFSALASLLDKNEGEIDN